MLKKISGSGFFGDKNGVAAVEFALVAPVLLLLLLGIIDFGNYINSMMRIEHTVRAAAEYVAQGGDIDDVEDDIINVANLKTDTVEIITMALVCECNGGEPVNCNGTCVDAEDYVRRFAEITLSGSYQTLFGWPGLPQSITLASSARLQVQ